MDEAAPSRTGIYVASALCVAVAAGAGFALYQLAGPSAVEGFAAVRAEGQGTGLAAAWRAARNGGVLPWLLIPTLGPVALAVLVPLLAPRAGGSARAEAGSTTGEEAALPSGAAGLRLLAALQEEARLVDFVRENLDEYSDEQVGAAVRGIHASLRKAVDERLTVQAILDGEDGDVVEVPAGFDPALIRVTGRPAGEPPFKGVLRHGGWRATDVRLPVASPGSDPTVLAPAEVEVESE